MNEVPARNSLRAALVRGERPQLVVTEKAPKLERETESLDVLVPRSESRRGDHRETGRHRLEDERARLILDEAEHDVALINLSGGGAMIRSPVSPRLWQLVELELGGCSRVECAVRWLRDGLVGLEFAHETRIDAEPEKRARLLLEVIQRSFPDSPVHVDLPQPVGSEPEDAPEEAGKRGDLRHPLVWMGQILHAFDSHPVRLRNLSEGGALVDVATAYPKNAEVVLDLGAAGQFKARIAWAIGDQAGLRFDEPFDIGCLARSRPDLTDGRWQRPAYLDDAGEQSWDQRWSRSSVEELRTELEGYLKH